MCWKSNRDREKAKNTKSTEIRLQHHQNQECREYIEQKKFYGIIVILQRDLQEINASVHVALTNYETKQKYLYNENYCDGLLSAFFAVSFASIPYRMQYANVKII